MLTPAAADALIQQHLPCWLVESLPLAQCTGAVLRENIYAERDQPPFDRVAMDGIAVDSAAWRKGQRVFKVLGLQAAGEPQQTLADAAAGCLEVMTGAVLPQGCDCVIPFEEIDLRDGQARPEAAPEPGRHVHRRGSDKRQGERLLQAGTLLGPPEIAVAAAAGMARIRVSGQPRIMVISTGNELVEPGEPILDYQLRRSNSYAVVAALRQRGFTRVGDDHLPDDLETLRARLKLHLDTHDVLITSGGVSRGRYDFLPQVLEELGVRAVFHRIAQRPGKPLWFGVASAQERNVRPAVFALPGNPVSTLVCLVRYVLPAFYQTMGVAAPHIEKIALSEPVESSKPLATFHPVRVHTDEWGRPWACIQATHGSGDYTALAGTDGFVELPPGPGRLPKGFLARLYRW